MTATTTLILYCGLILLASLIGGWLPMIVQLTHRRMEFALSFVAGVMLGVGVLHLLPHAVMARAATDPSGHGHLHIDHDGIHELLGPLLLWLIAGFLAMFFIERFFSFHHHDAPGHEGHHGHSHDHSHHRHGMTWAGAAIGLSLHSLIEGIALAASVAVMHDNQHANSPLSWAGLATFLVIFLHKPFDAMTIGTLMTAGKHSTRNRHLVNAGFALLIPIGVAIFFLGLNKFEANNLIISAALAFATGTFLCIALSDLLPELQFHHHDRGKLSLALILGLALAWGMAELESRMHQHDHDDTTPISSDG